MKKAIIMLIASIVVTLSGCTGWFTGHEYSAGEFIEVAKFLNVSKDRLKKYTDGDITLEDLNVSKKRLEEAYDYVKHFKDKNSTVR